MIYKPLHPSLATLRLIKLLLHKHFNCSPLQHNEDQIPMQGVPGLWQCEPRLSILTPAGHTTTNPSWPLHWKSHAVSHLWPFTCHSALTMPFRPPFQNTFLVMKTQLKYSVKLSQNPPSVTLYNMLIYSSVHSSMLIACCSGLIYCLYPHCSWGFPSR